uniref:Uncharacterized protein n=1 Tax=Glossina palpalis gambiensis TaxID=67801 RepID=A0A1B0BIT0_9MUSC
MVFLIGTLGNIEQCKNMPGRNDITFLVSPDCNNLQFLPMELSQIAKFYFSLSLPLSESQITNAHTEGQNYFNAVYEDEQENRVRIKSKSIR